MADQIYEPKGRIKSLDALRGFTMFWIIGGDMIMHSLPEISNNLVFRTLSKQLQHVEFEGFHFYDLIFPMFLFLIGTVLPISIKKRREKGASKIDLYKHILLRAAILFTLGLIYYGIKDPELNWLGYYGVLQLLAFAYFFASIIILNSGTRGIIIWTFGILTVYFMFMKLYPVPGYGPGVITPEGNFDFYVSNLVSQSLSPKWRYLLTPSMLPTISTCLFGILTGYWLLSNQSSKKKVSGMVFVGITLVTMALILTIWMPVVKNLWNTPYVLLTAGLSLLLLSLFYWLIDIKKLDNWAFFFIVIGLNPITIYILARIIDFDAIVYFFTQGFIDSLGSYKSLVFTISVTILHWLVVYWLYKRRIYIKV